MAKFNTAGVKSANGNGFIESEAEASSTTHEGGAGFARTAKSELFLSAVSRFFGEDSFYEGADSRDDRFVTLARKVAVADPEWYGQFVAWLRGDGNIRTAALVAAVEGADALREAGAAGGRQMVASALVRADEPGEALAYWISKHGRRIPQPIKRGIADAATKTYNEYSLGKYDSSARGFRFGDVIDLVHPTPRGGAQSSLFKYALDRRRDAKTEVPDGLTVLENRKAFLARSKDENRAALKTDPAAFSASLRDAGLTWEALSSVISGGMDKAAWEAMIPSMGYMALLRNLRNFDEAGVSNAVSDAVAKRIADPDEVAKSRQLPMRFLSAHRATANSGNYTLAIKRALDASLSNVPSLTGKTLILVDCSGSMAWAHSEKSQLNFMDTAAVFGSALALRAENATLVAFGSSSHEVSFKTSDSVLTVVERFKDLGGTYTAEAVRRHYAGHDRVIILTDEQTAFGNGPGGAVPGNVPLYTWNLAGYRYGHAANKKNRYTFGGLSDASFRTIDLIERGLDGNWPWV